ncbi:hypothetical protein RHMOL_Rhmol05G0186000 [Rhododendron molle]|uniref:Uncharacterized protein n=1 Tax=Rhododendron molle TaxID=49168 RepID=A0ACC0NSV6_RHOML|nr:hypothetical protein RHMOL_Rhmol05G0186000 [Rhododendron molle]
MKQPQHIQSVFEKHSTQEKRDYRTRLYATIVVARFLLRRGQAFRGHNKSEDSSDRGNFFELLQFLADHNENIRTNGPCLHYVNMKGIVIERFIGIVHVSSTTPSSLKEAIESLFARHGLSISRVRGQGYDRASNM